MPRIARFTIDSLADLVRQLRYAPRETRAKQMDAAEALAAEIERDQLYPEDFVIFRITGFRPQRMENPAILVGEALLADLANFIQLLSEGLDIPPSYRGRRAVAMDEIATRLSVASKTIQRYRKRGLICHYIRWDEGDQRLACFEDALERFVNGHEKQVNRARAFSRVSRSTEQSIVDDARRLRNEHGLSLNEAAQALAKKHHRAQETLRLLLRRHDRREPNPIFTEHGPLLERDIRVLYRAWRRGVPIARMAERFGRTKTTIHRAINRRRGELLGNLDLRFVELPTFARDDAAEVILAIPAVREGSQLQSDLDDALGLLEVKVDQFDSETDVALLAAYNFLKRRAAKNISALTSWPKAAALDAIETDLRWASRVKRQLVRLSVPTAIGRIEQHLERSLRNEPRERLQKALQLAAQVASSAVETVDSSRGQQLRRVVGYSTDRALAQGPLPRLAGRAAARHSAESISMLDPSAHVSPWDEFLSLPKRLESCMKRLDAPHRALLEDRYGSSSNAPQTVARIAQRRGVHPSTIAVRLAQAEVLLRRWAREYDDAQRDS